MRHVVCASLKMEFIILILSQSVVGEHSGCNQGVTPDLCWMLGVWHTHWSEPVLPSSPTFSSWNHYWLLHLFISLRRHMCDMGLPHEVCPTLPPKWVFQSTQGPIFWVVTGHKWGQVFYQTPLYAPSQNWAVSYSSRQKIQALVEQLPVGDKSCMYMCYTLIIAAARK